MTFRSGSVVIAAALLTVGAGVMAGCGGPTADGDRTAGGGISAGSSSRAGTVVDTRGLGALGPVLTTAEGRTLYMFPPDAERHVSCVAICAASWPPLTVAAHTSDAKAGPGVRQSLLGTDPDPAGGPAVVTYDGWPLYTYRDDVRPGQASGQDIDLDGGYWYVIAPSGQPITLTGP